MDVRLENLIPIQKGEVRNPKGRPKGSRNRSTIIREILELVNETGKDNEYSINMAQVEKALNGDTLAYKAIMDSAYGAPKQEIEQTNIERVIDWGIDETDSKSESTPEAETSSPTTETL